MIDNFFAALAEISPILPTLVRAVILLATIIAVWVAFSVPAYWLYRAVAEFIISAALTLAEVSRRLFHGGMELIITAARPIESFVTTHAQLQSFSAENKKIWTEIAKIGSSVDRVPSEFTALENSLNEAAREFDTAVDKISKLEVPPAVEPPGPQEFAAVRTVKNRAVVKLGVAILLSPPLILFNTGMLNEFFSGSWAGIDYFGVPLSLIISAFASVLEFALGAFLVLFPNRIAQLSLFLVLAALGFIELSFYARLGQEFNWSLFDAFYPPGAAPAITKLWFSVFGPSLVGILAFAGHALFGSIVELADQHVVRQWRSYISQRMVKARALRALLADAERAKQTVSIKLADIRSSFGDANQTIGSKVGTLETAKNQFSELVEYAVAIRLEDARRLDRGAMLRVLIESLFFAGTAVFALTLIAFVYTGITILGAPPPIAEQWLGWSMALGEAVILLGAGSAAGGHMILPATEGKPATNLPQERFGPAIGLSILCVVVVGNAFYVLRDATVVGVMWAALLAAASAWLFWSGMRLGLIGAATWTVVRCGCRYVLAAAVVVTGAIVFLVRLTFELLRVLLTVLAYPYTVLFAADRGRDRALAKAAA